MTKLLSIAAVIALMSTPTLAKTNAVQRHHLREAPVSLSQQAYPGDLAIKGGKVMGRDPDSHVRFELGRDNPTY